MLSDDRGSHSDSGQTGKPGCRRGNRTGRLECKQIWCSPHRGGGAKMALRSQDLLTEIEAKYMVSHTVGVVYRPAYVYMCACGGVFMCAHMWVWKPSLVSFLRSHLSCHVFFLDLCLLFICACVYVPMLLNVHWGPNRWEESSGSPAARVPGSCEPSGVTSRKGTQALCKSSKCFKAPTHVSSPC